MILGFSYFVKNDYVKLESSKGLNSKFKGKGAGCFRRVLAVYVASLPLESFFVVLSLKSLE